MNQRPPVTAAGLTDPGMQRQNNEDVWSGPPPDLTPEQAAAKGYLYIVADGVGGQQGGKVASQIAVQVTQQVYYATPSPDIGACLSAAIQEANRRIYHQGITAAGQYGMSTTITAAVIRGSEIILANVGDSRAYLIRNGQATQLTTDHTWVEERRQVGVLTDEEAANHPQRNIITRSLGGSLDVIVDVFGPHPLALGDQILLCTDGLCDLASGPEMAGLIARGRNPSAAVQQLLGLARRRGAPDNVTAVVAGMGINKQRTRSIPIGVWAMLAMLAAVSLVGWMAAIRGRDALSHSNPTPRPTLETPAPATSPIATPTLAPAPVLSQPENAAEFQTTDEIVLSWEWERELKAQETFVVIITDSDGRDVANESTRESTYVFVPDAELPADGIEYAWSVMVEKEREGEYLAVSDGANLLTFSVKPPTPTAIPNTRELACQATQPTLLEPGQGSTQKGLVTFRWEGELCAGQSFEVQAWHTEHDTKSSGSLTMKEWTLDLPGDQSGDWHWTVSVVENGQIVATSEEWGFCFQPFEDGGGEDGSEGGPTPETR